jgi:hypothetical protein
MAEYQLIRVDARFPSQLPDKWGEEERGIAPASDPSQVLNQALKWQARMAAGPNQQASNNLVWIRSREIQHLSELKYLL